MIEIFAYQTPDSISKKQQQALADQCLLERLSIRTGIAPQQLSFYKGPKGKPYLNQAPDVFFNLSHSGNKIVIALSQKEIGVDVERIRPRDYAHIARRYYAEIEQAYLFKHDEPEQLAAFISLWTLKESYLKLIGAGLSGGLSTYPIEITEQDILVHNHQGKRPYFKQYELPGHYKLSICAYAPDFPAEIFIQAIV